MAYLRTSCCARRALPTAAGGTKASAPGSTTATAAAASSVRAVETRMMAIRSSLCSVMVCGSGMVKAHVQTVMEVCRRYVSAQLAKPSIDACNCAPKQQVSAIFGLPLGRQRGVGHCVGVSMSNEFKADRNLCYRLGARPTASIDRCRARSHRRRRRTLRGARPATGEGDSLRALRGRRGFCSNVPGGDRLIGAFKHPRHPYLYWGP